MCVAAPIIYPAHEWRAADPTPIPARLERHLHRLPETIADLRQEAQTARAEQGHAASRIGIPFPDTTLLSDLRQRQAEINDALLSERADTADSANPPQKPRTPDPHDPARGLLGRLDAPAVAAGGQADLTR